MVLSVSVGVVGGGPAGSAAAIAALSEARSVHIFEKSGFPRHKVCGEFLSPEIVPLLESLGIWQEFLRLRPAHIKRTILHFGALKSSNTKFRQLPKAIALETSVRDADSMLPRPFMHASLDPLLPQFGLLRFLGASFTFGSGLAAENLFLRKQLALYQEPHV